MTRNEFTFPSADGKTGIHAVEWLPEGHPRAVLQVSHGVAEYVLRYEPLAEYFTARGFAVAGHDHLGHGGSVAPGGARLYFGPKGSWNWVVDDLYTRYNLLKKQFPDIPLFLLGHSMGSFLARTYLIRYPGTVDGAVIMGTGQMSPALVAAGRAVAALERRRVGEDQASPAVDRLAFGAYNKQFAPNRTGFDWLSLNPENVDRYIADPLCGGSASIGLFREMLEGLPERRTVTSSTMEMISSNLWVMRMMDFPSSRMPRSVLKNAAVSWGVSTAVGSSRIKISAPM